MNDLGFKSNELSALRKRLKELLKKATLNFYIAKKLEIIFEVLDYPYRLMSVKDIVNSKYELNKNYISTMYRSKYIILDSGIFDERVTNKTICSIAKQIQPTYVVPKDYFGDSKNTMKSIHDFLSIKDSYLDDRTSLLIPLQNPWTIDASLEAFEYFAIGGIINMSMIKKIRTIESILKKYPHKKFHLFGVLPMTMPEVLKKYPNIKSVDVAIARNVIFERGDYLSRGKAYAGEYSGLPEKFNLIYHILNQLVGFYNFKKNKNKSTQMRLF